MRARTNTFCLPVTTFTPSPHPQNYATVLSPWLSQEAVPGGQWAGFHLGHRSNLAAEWRYFLRREGEGDHLPLVHSHVTTQIYTRRQTFTTDTPCPVQMWLRLGHRFTSRLIHSARSYKAVPSAPQRDRRAANKNMRSRAEQRRCQKIHASGGIDE